MKKGVAEFLVGLFVLVGIVCVGYMTVALGELDVLNRNEYVLKAEFESVSGLKEGARVEIAGIEVGRVGTMVLDQKTDWAVVEIKLRNDVKVDEDVIASIRTSGLIGDRYVKLTPGGSEKYLTNGGTITETESPVDIEELISKYVFGGTEE